MKIAPQKVVVGLALLAVPAGLFLAGCTLSGSSGLGDVTPVSGGDTGGGLVTPLPQPTLTPLPTLIPATTPTTEEAAGLSDLEALGTQAAVTATAEAAGTLGPGGATSVFGSETGTPSAGPGGPVVTSALGGEILPPTNTPFGTPVAAQVQECPPTHTVAQGENMYRIALRYGTSVQTLAQENGIANPDQISVGLVLKIPACGTATAGSGASASGGQPAAAAIVPGNLPGGTTHVVQPGENLFRIALQYNMSWTTLAAANGIINPNILVVGQTLRIP